MLSHQKENKLDRQTKGPGRKTVKINNKAGPNVNQLGCSWPNIQTCEQVWFITAIEASLLLTYYVVELTSKTLTEHYYPHCCILCLDVKIKC